MNGQTLPDLEELNKELEELDLEGEIPKEIEDLTPDSTEEEKKKAAHAFGQLRSTLKTAKAVISEMSRKETPTEPATVEKSPSSQGQLAPEQQAELYLNNLRTRAMNNTGIFDLNNPLVTMEVQRLYGEDSAQARRQLDAEKEAESIVENTLSSFSQLEDADKAQLRERISTRPAIEKADPEVVKGEIHRYLGENLEKFKTKEPKTPATNGQTGAAGAAAASSVKSQGSPGVELGKGTAGEGEKEVKPLTPTERKRIKALGITHPTSDQIALFRRAEAKKGKVRSS
jgi:hypothetical protein